jgi:hypothetical protein
MFPSWIRILLLRRRRSILWNILPFTWNITLIKIFFSFSAAFYEKQNIPSLNSRFPLSYHSFP